MEQTSSDLISNLPEDLLRRILSFLPLKDAVRTSLLSPLWRSFWAPFAVAINLGPNENATRTISELMLKSYSSPEVWKLYLGLSSTSTKNYSSEMNEKLIIQATKGVERELHLNFYPEKQETISHYSLKMEVSETNIADFSAFSTLKTLHLRSVTSVSEFVASDLFSSCEFLECLKLEKCAGLQFLDIKGAVCLKNLTILECGNVVDVAVCAPNLESFSYRGVLPRIWLENCLKLVDVMVDMSDGPGDDSQFDCEEILLLLMVLKDVETLTLSGWLLEWLCSAGVIFRKLEFRFSKLKELFWIESSVDRGKRDSLAYFLDICPSLEGLFINIDQSRKTLICPQFCHYWHEPYFWLDYGTDHLISFFSLQLEKFKVVKMFGYKNSEEELLLLDLLLKKAVLLRLVIVTTMENHSWQVVKIPLSQLELTTTRTQSEHMDFISPNKNYFFRFIEEDS